MTNMHSCLSERFLLPRQEVPIVESGLIQIGRGQAEFETVRLLGHNLSIVRLKVAPKMSGYIVPDNAWMIVHFPLAWTSDFVFNGQIAEHGQAFVSVGRDGYSTVGTERDTIAVGVRKDSIANAIAALAGISSEQITYSDITLSTRSHEGRSFKTTLLNLTEQLDQSAFAPGRYNLNSTVEADLISSLASFLLPFVTNPSLERASHLDALKVVRQAEYAARSASHTQTSLADMCKAAGVSRAWLHRCFVEIYGMSPVRCLRLWRLTAARDTLLDLEQGAALVKETALQYGFRHSGRFGSEYQAIFGEYPAETLLRRKNSV